MLWAEQLKEEYSKIAKVNQGTRNDITSSSNEPKVSNVTRQKVAEDLDMSESTFMRSEYIFKNADEEMIKDLDENKLSINKAYTTLKEQLKQKDNEIDNYKQQLTQAEENKSKAISESNKNRNKPNRLQLENNEKIEQPTKIHTDKELAKLANVGSGKIISYKDY